MLQRLTNFKKIIIDANTREQCELFTNLIEKSTDLSLPVKLKIAQDQKVLPVPTFISNDVLNDVEFFNNYRGTQEGTVFEKLSQHVSTTGGKTFFKTILEYPTSDPITIINRQNILKQTTNIINTYPDLIHDLETIKSNESDIFWLFEDTEENLRDLYDMVYFRFMLLRPLNKNSHALTGINLYKIFASPAIGILSPIIYFIVPYLILTWKLKITIPFSTYMKFMFSSIIHGDLLSTLFGTPSSMSIGQKSIKWISFLFSMLFYFQGLFNSVEVSRTIYKISKFLVNKTNKIVETIVACERLIDKLWDPIVIDAFAIDGLSKEVPMITLDYMLSVKSETFESFKIYKNFGKSLSFLKNIKYEVLIDIMKRIYVIDSIIGTISYLQSLSSNQSCFTDIITDNKSPLININKGWHICLDAQKAIPNDVNLEANNMILTGPNAGGKSTFIKTLVINVLLAQTLGICMAERASITPYDMIHTQINIPDCKGKESLFEAEMYRCKNTLELLKQKGKKLIVMDEIFNSTNPVEGISGAYAVANKIAHCNTATLVFTTHFTYLTKLSKTNRFTNYKMNVLRDSHGRIEFPYKLEKGISKQYVALELLMNNGFDTDILDEAISIKNKLTNKK